MKKINLKPRLGVKRTKHSDGNYYEKHFVRIHLAPKPSPGGHKIITSTIGRPLCGCCGRWVSIKIEHARLSSASIDDGVSLAEIVLPDDRFSAVVCSQCMSAHRKNPEYIEKKIIRNVLVNLLGANEAHIHSNTGGSDVIQ